jgi:hypothetical protein
MIKQYKTILKDFPHSRVENHFLIMSRMLPYGGTLRGCKLGHRIIRHIDPVRWSILDALYPEDEEDYDD